VRRAKSETADNGAPVGFLRQVASVDRRRLARYVLQEVTVAFRLFGLAPGGRAFRGDLTPLLVKFWPVFSYLIVYNPGARPLAIVRVLHGRQDVAAILDRGT
jgi:hypothetical protein